MPEFDKDIIVKKIKAKEPLTVEEQRWYIHVVHNQPMDVVDRMLAIAKNEDPNLILD